MLLLLLISAFALVASDASPLQNEGSSGIRVQDEVDKLRVHPVLNDASPDHPRDTDAIEQTNNHHYYLDNTITQEHQQQPSSNEATPRLQARSIGTGAIVAATAYIHPTATLQSGCIVKDHAQVWNHAFVGSGAILEEHTIVGLHARVEQGAIMKERSRLLDYSQLSAGQILPAGAVR